MTVQIWTVQIKTGHHSKQFLSLFQADDGAGNTVEENSSVLHMISTIMTLVMVAC